MLSPSIKRACKDKYMRHEYMDGSSLYIWLRLFFDGKLVPQ